MELNSKEDLYSTLNENTARLSIIEQSTNEKTKDDMPKDDDNSKDETTEVETVDEIEKLLNSSSRKEKTKNATNRRNSKNIQRRWGFWNGKTFKSQ